MVSMLIHSRKVTLAHIYKRFYSLLDIDWIRLEATDQLSSHFVDECIMSQLLAVLHDAHDASLKERFVSDHASPKRRAHLGLITPFLINSTSCFLPLVAGLHLRYNSADLDFLQIRREFMIKGK